MSYANDNVFTSYLGNGVDDTFSITFSFMPGEYSTIKAALFDVSDITDPVRLADPILDGAGTYDYTLSISAPTGGSEEETATATVNTPIPTDHRIYFYRESGSRSNIFYSDLRFPYKTVQKDLDRLYQTVQENRKGLENINALESFIPGDEPGSPFRELIKQTISDLESTSLAPVLMGAGDTTGEDESGKVYVFTDAGVSDFFLPNSHTTGHRITVVDGSGTVSNKTIDPNGNNIIGVAGAYSLQSEYESKTFVSNGEDWYII